MTEPMLSRSLQVYGRRYRVDIRRGHAAPPDAPRLVVVGFQPNETAREILRLCLDSIRRFTPEPHELWVVDNCSPPRLSGWLAAEPGLNVIFNRTEPEPGRQGLDRIFRKKAVPYGGSYANAVALEIAAQTIDPDARIMMTLHMDTMACKTGWLGYLRNHLDDRVRAVGVRMDTARVRTVHVLGLMFDFTLFRALNLSFRHDLPRYDCGDGISIALARAGYGLWACRNTLHQPELVELLPPESPYRGMPADRAFDDDNDIIFMHLGRGILSAQGRRQEARITPENWLRFGRAIVSAPARQGGEGGAPR